MMKTLTEAIEAVATTIVDEARSASKTVVFHSPVVEAQVLAIVFGVAQNKVYPALRAEIERQINAEKA